MEEVWKDITLTTLHGHHQGTPTCCSSPSSSSFRGMILQDFLAAAPLKRPQLHQVVSPSPHAHAPLLLPHTALSLNSGLDLQYMGGGSSANSNSNSSSNGHNAAAAAAAARFVGPPSPSAIFSLFTNRRSSVPETCNAVVADRRHKRMIKNRESAARSRARKQAYTKELELKVANLLEENAKLRKQERELQLALAAQVPKRNALQRSSTAPF